MRAALYSAILLLGWIKGSITSNWFCEVTCCRDTNPITCWVVLGKSADKRPQCTVPTEMPSSARRKMQTIPILHRAQSFQVLHCVSMIIASVSRCLSVELPVSLFVLPTIHPSIQPYFHLSIKPPTCQSVYGSLTKSNPSHPCLQPLFHLSASDVWLTVHRNSGWLRKTN